MSENADNTGSSTDLPETENPFVGPRSIPTGKPLFGRDREVRDLYRILVADRIVLLHGPSGCGKSSLVNAGLIPRLALPRSRGKGSTVWPIVRLNTEPPRGGEALEIDRYTLSALTMLAAERVKQGAATPEALRGMSFCDFFAKLADGGLEATEQVLIFDQFEEVLTTDPDDTAGKQAFFEGLGRLLKYPGFHAVFSIRDEFVGALEPYRKLIPRGFETRYRLELLGQDEATNAIVGPTAGTPAPITAGAAALLVGELCKTKVRRGGKLVEVPGPYVEPVQLQVVCYRLWEKHHATGPIGEDLVRGEAGNVDSALADFYAAGVAAALAKVPNLSERRIREWCEQRLITPQGTRGQVQEGDETDPSLPPQAITALIDARIVRGEERRGLTWYELAHDRLIEPVRASNAAWLEDRLQPWQRQADLYAKTAQKESLLLGRELKDARTWADIHGDEVSESERDYLEDSADRDEAERKSRRLSLAIRGLVTAFLVGMISLTLLAVWQRNKAQRLLVVQSLTRGLDLCQQTNVMEGMHWLVRSLEQSESLMGRADRHEQLIREEISAWFLEIPRFKAVFPTDGSVVAVAFSPDGLTALTGSSDNTARLWDVKTGQPRGATLKHEGGVVDVAFSPDSQTALTGSWDHTARLWDVKTGEPTGKVLKHEERVRAVAFSPDGQTALTGSWDNTARLWDVKTGEPRGKVLTHEGVVNDVAFSPDGLTALTGSGDNTARLWDVKTGEPRGAALKHEGVVRAVTFSPDGQTALTGSADNTARLWDVKTGEPTGVVLKHEGFVVAVAFSPNGQTALTGSGDHTARLWDVKTGEPTGTTLKHEGIVNDVSFSLDGQTALTGSWDNTARLWDAQTGEPRGAALKHEGDVNAVAFSPDGQTALTGSADNTARLWDVMTRQPRGAALKHEGDVNAVAFSPDGQTALTGSGDNAARLWDAQTGEARGAALKHEGVVNAVSFSLDGQTALTGSGDNAGWLWDVQNGLHRGTALKHNGPVVAVAFSPDGQTALTGSADSTARLWDVKTGERRGKVLTHGGVVNAVAFSPDGQTALTGGGDNTARLWDVQTGEARGAALKHEGAVRAVAFSPDGRIALTGSADNTARLWDVQTGLPRGAVLQHKGWVSAVAFSPDGHAALTGSWDKTARFWDVQTGKPGDATLKHEGRVFAVAFSSDGQIVLTGSGDNTARLWDVQTGLPRGAALEHEGSVNAVAFSPDGRTALTGSFDRAARLWFLPEKVDESPKHLRLWVEVRTWLTMDDQGGTRWLKPDEWKRKQEELRVQGGPP